MFFVIRWIFQVPIGWKKGIWVSWRVSCLCPSSATKVSSLAYGCSNDCATYRSKGGGTKQQLWHTRKPCRKHFVAADSNMAFRAKPLFNFVLGRTLQFTGFLCIFVPFRISESQPNRWLVCLMLTCLSVQKLACQFHCESSVSQLRQQASEMRNALWSLIQER